MTYQIYNTKTVKSLTVFDADTEEEAAAYFAEYVAEHSELADELAYAKLPDPSVYEYINNIYKMAGTLD